MTYAVKTFSENKKVDPKIEAEVGDPVSCPEGAALECRFKLLQVQGATGVALLVILLRSLPKAVPD